jgi:hypothetical protein
MQAMRSRACVRISCHRRGMAFDCHEHASKMIRPILRSERLGPPTRRQLFYLITPMCPLPRGKSQRWICLRGSEEADMRGLPRATHLRYLTSGIHTCCIL